MLSGNRNFEGRIHPLVKTNWLASPPLVVAYALAGNMNIDLTREPLGQGKNGEPVYLKDIWPSGEEIARAVEQVSTEMFRKEYAEVFSGTEVEGDQGGGVRYLRLAGGVDLYSLVAVL